MKNGLLLHAYRIDLGYRGCEVVLDSPELKTDATTLQIVVDEHFGQLVEWLRLTIHERAVIALDTCRQKRLLDSQSCKLIENELSNGSRDRAYARKPKQ